jgi:plasmid stabilization system protein ParE
MSLRVEIFPHAETDLEVQYDWYLEHAGIEIAERYLKAFDATVATLASHPGLGHLRKFRDTSLAGIRAYPIKAPFDKHLVFHRASLTKLSVVRVIHGARDLPRRLTELQ